MDHWAYFPSLWGHKQSYAMSAFRSNFLLFCFLCVCLIVCLFVSKYINKTGFRVCLKELYEKKYDPLSVIYAVLSGKVSSYCAFQFHENSVLKEWLNFIAAFNHLNRYLRKHYRLWVWVMVGKFFHPLSFVVFLLFVEWRLNYCIQQRKSQSLVWINHFAALSNVTELATKLMNTNNKRKMK